MVRESDKPDAPLAVRGKGVCPRVEGREWSAPSRLRKSQAVYRKEKLRWSFEGQVARAGRLARDAGRARLEPLPRRIGQRWGATRAPLEVTVRMGRAGCSGPAYPSRRRRLLAKVRAFRGVCAVNKPSCQSQFHWPGGRNARAVAELRTPPQEPSRPACLPRA